MDLLPDTTPLPPDVDPSADGNDLSPPQPGPRRGAQPRNANALKHDLYAALQSQADPSGSSASAGDTLREAITHLRAIIDQLDHLPQAAESLKDKIKLSSALGVAAVRLSTLLRTQKILSPESADEVAQALNEAL